MPANSDAVEIVVCYGTSCFARGNSENLRLLNQFAKREGGRVSLRVKGKLCQDQCQGGPNLIINGKLHHGVTTERLRELLGELEQQSGVDHGAA